MEIHNAPNSMESKLNEILKTHEIILFMKGTPDFPQCGVSAKGVAILLAMNVSFHAVNILQWPEIKQSLSEKSKSQKYPQLYIRGDYIGTYENMLELYESGALSKKIQG